LKILLIRGPVIITVYGECNILGVKITNQRICWNSTKILPIEKRDNTKIHFGGSKYSIYGIYSSDTALGMAIWKDILRSIMDLKYKKIVVIGASDSGKSTFSLYLANKFIESNLRPYLIDADVGQGDLAPPTCIGSAVLLDQKIDLSMIKADQISFIGSIQPAKNEIRIIRCVSKLINKSKPHDVCIVNTDGYLHGMGLYYKLRLIEKIKPDCVVCLGDNNICKNIKKFLRQLSNWKCSIINGRKPNPIIRRSSLLRFEKRLNTFSRFVNLKESNSVQIPLKDVKSIYFRYVLMKSANYNLLNNIFIGLGSSKEKDIVNGFGLVKNFENDILTILTTCKKFDSIYMSDLQLDFSV
jgi:polynucleotide 5'-hydroxyl-kinase GRC3/NOL9